MDCMVQVKNGSLTPEETQAYVAHATQKFGRCPARMEITLDGEYADIHYDFAAAPFHRIRRITGYLVGTLDRFNNGKRAEEADRVKHAVCS